MSVNSRHARKNVKIRKGRRNSGSMVFLLPTLTSTACWNLPNTLRNCDLDESVKVWELSRYIFSKEDQCLSCPGNKDSWTRISHRLRWALRVFRMFTC